MRSQVQGEKAGNSEVSNTRTSKTGWLQDSFDPVIQRLAERIGRITGLNTNTWNDDAELLQVANYLNGGHYNPHHDYVMKDREPEHVSSPSFSCWQIAKLWPITIFFPRKLF